MKGEILLRGPGDDDRGPDARKPPTPPQDRGPRLAPAPKPPHSQGIAPLTESFTMPRRAALLLATLLALATTANAEDNPIIARMTAFAEVYNTGDAAAIAGFYAPDAALLPPGQASVLGREAIAQHYAQAFAGGARDLQFKVFDIRGFETNAVEIGETVVMVGEQRIVGRYMHLWEIVEGELLLTRDMYHVLKVDQAAQ